MIRRSTAAALLFSMLAFSQTGCIGQMGLSGEVMKFNLNVVEDKWARELVFLVMYIVPVYPIAGAIDLIIINSLEFHTGTNPITDKPRIALREGAEDVVAPDGTRAVASELVDGRIEITTTDEAGNTYRMQLVPVPGGVEAHDIDGKILGRVPGDGILHVENGQTLQLPQS